MPAADEDIHATAEAQEAPEVETIAELQIIEPPPEDEEQIELPPDAELMEIETIELPAPPAGSTRIVVVLSRPITVDGKTVKRVAIRSPMLAEVDAVATGRFQVGALIERMTDVSMASLSWPDADFILSVATILLPAGIRPGT